MSSRLIISRSGRAAKVPLCRGSVTILTERIVVRDFEVTAPGCVDTVVTDLALLQRTDYRFGRELDGAPARPWRWAELALTSIGRLPQAEGDRDRADPDEQGDGVGHDKGQVARGDAVADPQAEPDQQDREVPDRHIPGGSVPEHPADLQDG
jgi:hypothetical protein